MKLGKAVKLAKGEDYVIAGYERYMQHRDPAKEGQILAELMQPDRNRMGSWSASAGGSCLRQQQLTYLGYPQRPYADRTMNIFANGDYVHARHQAAGLIEGYITDVEVPVDVPELKLRGTMDGILANGAILEIKSIHTNGYAQVNSFGAKYEHKLQVHAYMMATGIDRAHILYEDKNTQNLKELLITRDEELVEKIKSGVDELNEATDEQRLIPQLRECKNMTGRFRTCPHALVCESATWK